MSDKMTVRTIRRDNELNLRFTGYLVGSSSSHDPISGPNNTRWTELRIWRTKGGRLVCGECHLTQWQGESDTYNAIVCDTEKEVVNFFGTDEIAKSLYEAADIEVVEEVE